MDEVSSSLPHTPINTRVLWNLALIHPRGEVQTSDSGASIMPVAIANTSQSEQFHQVDRHFTSEAKLWTELYQRDDLYALGFQIRLRQALTFIRNLKLPPGTPALDVGCGGGWAAIELARTGLQVTGLDISGPMIATARRNAEQADLPRSPADGNRPNPSFEVGNLVNMGYSPQTFGLIVGLGVFEYFPDRLAAAREISRLLSSGGTLVVTIPNPDRVTHRVTRWRAGALNRFWRIQRLCQALSTTGRGKQKGIAAQKQQDETPAVQRHNMSPEAFDALWAEHGLQRIGYAANGLGCGAETLANAPLLGRSLAGVLARGLEAWSTNGDRRLVNACSGYLGVYRKV